MNVLVACEESQRVCAAFRKRGHEAYSCDIMDCSGGHPEWHIKGDVLEVLNPTTHYGWISEDEAEWCGIEFNTVDGAYHRIDGKWDMIIAHPPCTDLAVSGARHFEKKRENGSQRASIEFFCQFLKANCDKIAIENPIGIISGDYISKWFPDLADEYGLPKKQAQIIQPYEYGHPARKGTCLWLKNLPILKPTQIVEPELLSYTCKSGKKVTFSKDYCSNFDWNNADERRKNRSKTYEGIAEAMAEQWG